MQNIIDALVSQANPDDSNISAIAREQFSLQGLSNDSDYAAAVEAARNRAIDLAPDLVRNYQPPRPTGIIDRLIFVNAVVQVLSSLSIAAFGFVTTLNLGAHPALALGTGTVYFGFALTAVKTVDRDINGSNEEVLVFRQDVTEAFYGKLIS